MHIISGALLLVRTHRRELLLQVLAYPVLALLWAAWLWIPDAHWYQLLLTALLALAIALSGLWINATTMRAYREESSSTSALRMLSLLLWFVILAALLWWVGSWTRWLTDLSPYLYSKMSHGTREAVRLPRLTGFFYGLQTCVFWYCIPALLFPFAVEWASHSLLHARYRVILRSLASAGYWAGFVPVALIAAWMPGYLVSAQLGHSLSAQTFSVVVRVALAYFVFLGCWMFAIALAAQSLRDTDSVRNRIAGEPAPQPA